MLAIDSSRFDSLLTEPVERRVDSELDQHSVTFEIETPGLSEPEELPEDPLADPHLHRRLASIREADATSESSFQSAIESLPEDQPVGASRAAAKQDNSWLETEV